MNGTPTFFINGIRYDGSWDAETLMDTLSAVVLRLSKLTPNICRRLQPGHLITIMDDTQDPGGSYHQPLDDVIARLGTSRQRGLTDAEAQSRLGQYGRNELPVEKKPPAWRRFLKQFEDVLVILLLVATAISVGLWAYEQEAALPYEAIAIFAVVLLNAAMGYIQESRAEAAVAALRAMSAAQAIVIRDGERRRVPAAEIVPGDIILIDQGDTIPADGRVLNRRASDAEATLTGESLPVTKDTKAIAEEVPLGDRANMVFSRNGRNLRAAGRPSSRQPHSVTEIGPHRRAP